MCHVWTTLWPEYLVVKTLEVLGLLMPEHIFGCELVHVRPILL